MFYESLCGLHRILPPLWRLTNLKTVAVSAAPLLREESIIVGSSSDPWVITCDPGDPRAQKLIITFSHLLLLPALPSFFWPFLAGVPLFGELTVKRFVSDLPPCRLTLQPDFFSRPLNLFLVLYSTSVFLSRPFSSRWDLFSFSFTLLLLDIFVWELIYN